MPGKIHDISPSITPDLAVYPGDTPFSQEHLLLLKQGDPVTLSTIRTTVHLGAHIDGPNHYDPLGAGIESVPLERCIGTCQVITVNAMPATRFAMNALRSSPRHPRVLLRTQTYSDPNQWTNDFAAPEPECVASLATLGVILLGIDTPSVDTATSKDLPSHDACRKNDITILEGLVLDNVPDGEYELIALPLKMIGLDASPVRAILRELD